MRYTLSKRAPHKWIVFFESILTLPYSVRATPSIVFDEFGTDGASPLL